MDKSCIHRHTRPRFFPQACLSLSLSLSPALWTMRLQLRGPLQQTMADPIFYHTPPSFIQPSRDERSSPTHDETNPRAVDCLRHGSSCYRESLTNTYYRCSLGLGHIPKLAVCVFFFCSSSMEAMPSGTPRLALQQPQLGAPSKLHGLTCKDAQGLSIHPGRKQSHRLSMFT